MLKKALVCFGSAVAVLVLCLLLFVYKGTDEVTFFQRQNINQYLASVPFEENLNGSYKLMPAAVGSGTDGYPCNTFLGARNQIDYATGYIEVKVAVTEDREAVLAESFDSISEEPVKLSRVMEQLNEEYDDCGMVIELSEYSRLGYINAQIINNHMIASCVITGVHENAVSFVKGFFPQTKVLCDYDGENRLSLEEIRLSGADGILCKGDTFNDRLLAKAKEQGLLVWVDCGTDVYMTVKALKFGADGIITDRPQVVTYLGSGWNEAMFEEAVKVTKE